MALSHFLLTVIACLALYAFPATGLWPVLLAATVLAARWFSEKSLLHLTFVDGLMAVFLFTAIVGYWVGYDPVAAWLKLRLLLTGALLFYAIITQPRTNLGFLAGFWFILGVGVAVYFLLTQDFEVSPAKFLLINRIGLFWMSVRPALNLPAIQSADMAAGIVLITSIYGLNFLDAKQGKRTRSMVYGGFGIAFSAVILATSRGALIALIAALGIWLAWLLIGQHHPSWKQRIPRLFPWGMMLLIFLMALFLILPFRSVETDFRIDQNPLLNRAELIQQGITIMKDFPVIGGGLGSFPGLFSQYILVVPYFFLLNSHNIFVDVMVEQGMVGGFVFLSLFGMGIWKISSRLNPEHSRQIRIMYGAVFISMFVTVVHGLVDDYLYSSWGTLLIFVPLGMGLLFSSIEPAYMSNSWDWSWPHQFNTTWKGWRPNIDLRTSLVLTLLLMALGVRLVWDQMAAEWYANLGAAKMAKIDLTDYPANHWDDGVRVSQLQDVQLLFERSLSYNPDNRTANHRLGLIKLSERDFKAAALYLEKAYGQDASNRGVIKNLGYSYAWLGDFGNARLYLGKIPEAQSELNVYGWWWGTLGRQDLSIKAIRLSSYIGNKDEVH